MLINCRQGIILSLLVCTHILEPISGFRIGNWDVGRTFNDATRIVDTAGRQVGNLGRNIGNSIVDTVNPSRTSNSAHSSGLEVIVFVTKDWWWHGWIQVGDTLYNFSKDGVGRRSAGSGLSNLKHRFPVGRTRKTKEEFNNWVFGPRSRFTKSSYNVATNNCNHFVREACRYLGLAVPVYSPLGFR